MRMIGAIGVSLMMIGSAGAADLGTRPPAASFSWAGFYLGMHGGYGSGDSDGVSLSGGFGGGQLGVNWQPASAPWVIGIEVDSAWASFGRSDTFVGGGVIVTAKSNADYMGSVRGRVGYAPGQSLLYVTGGMGWVHNEISVSATVAPFTIGLTSDNVHLGWMVGAGWEYALNPNWSLRLEYLYADYGSENYFAGVVAGGVPMDAQVSTVKVGVNYLFR